jgi:hypothetical protein
MANKDDELHAGFTGNPVETTGSMTEKARSAIATVKDEAGAVSAAVADHPQTTTTLLLAISALAFGIGYALGHASGSASRPRLWR